MGSRAILLGLLVAADACECTTARAAATTTGGETPYVEPMTDTTTTTMPFDGTTTGIDYAVTTGGYVLDLGPPPPPMPPDLPWTDPNAPSEISGPDGNAISEIDGRNGALPSEIDGPAGNEISEMHGPPVEHSDPISEIPPGS